MRRTVRPKNGAVSVRGVARHRSRQEAITRLLWEIDRRILQQEPLQQVLGFLVNELGRLFPCPFIWIGLKESDGRTIPVAQHGLEAVARATPFRWEEPDPDPRPSVLAMRSGRVQIGLIDPAGLGDWRQTALGNGLRSYACLPLMAGGLPVGVLSLASTDAEPPRHKAVAALQAIADQVAISVISARAQEQIRLQHVALESSANAVMIMNAAGHIFWVNQAFTRITGVEPAEALGRAPRAVLSDEKSDLFWEGVAATLVRGLSWRGECRMHRTDGTTYIVEKTITAVRDEGGSIAHYVWTLHDVTDRKEGEARLHYMTLYDPLTGLPNRRTLEEYMAGAAHSRALLLIGADRFKLVNDLMGKEAGNQVLIGLAKLLKGALGPEHLLVRLDEDLFAVLARAASTVQARALAEELRATIEEAHLQLVAGGLEVTVSVGVAMLAEGQEPIRLAGQALTEAKRLGRNRVVLAEELGGAEQPAMVVLLLQEALRGTGFQLHLQPIQRLAGEVTEFHEVLLRLQEPGGGLLLPGQFMEAAAQYHLLPHIDGWVVAEVLRLLTEWSHLRLFVNLSGQGLSSVGLLASIEAQVQAAGPAVAGRLVFEITETTAVRDLGSAREWMTSLSGLGVQFALDDFGSGFSSFEYLAALPVQFVKVSGVFVRNIDTDPRHRAMVEAITTVSHALGKAVIAEWVESRRVAELLAEMGVEFGQGYALGRPSPL